MQIEITQQHIDHWRQHLKRDDMPATWSGDGVFLVFEETAILVVADGRALIERQSDELRAWFANFYGGGDVEPIQFELFGSKRVDRPESRVDRCNDQTEQTISQQDSAS